MIRDMPSPGSTPVSSMEDGWLQKNSHLELVLKVAKPTMEQRKLPFTLTAAKTLSKQAGHWGIDCSVLPRQGRSLQIPTSQDSLSDPLGLVAEDWNFSGTSVPSDHRGTWVAGKLLSLLIDLEAVSLLTLVKITLLRPGGVWWLGYRDLYLSNTSPSPQDCNRLGNSLVLQLSFLLKIQTGLPCPQAL